MGKDNLYSSLWTIGIFLILSTVVMGISIVIMVALNDYVYYQFYEIAAQMVASGFMGASVLPLIEGIATDMLSIIPFFDKIWVVAFLIFFIDYIKNAYYAKREGFMSVFGFLSFGVMITLFALSLLVTYNTAIYDLFFVRLLENLTVNLTFFNYYIANFQIINLIMIILGVIVNFVPFDLSSFNNRKVADKIEEEVQ